MRQGRQSGSGENESKAGPHGELMMSQAFKVYSMADKGNVLKMNFSVGVSM